MLKTIRRGIGNLIYWPSKFVYEAAKIALGSVGYIVFGLLGGIAVWGLVITASAFSLAAMWFFGATIVPKFFGKTASEIHEVFLSRVKGFSTYLHDAFLITIGPFITKVIPDGWSKEYTSRANKFLTRIFGPRKPEAAVVVESDADEPDLELDSLDNTNGFSEGEAAIAQLLRTSAQNQNQENKALKKQVKELANKLNKPKEDDAGVTHAANFGWWLGEQAIEYPVAKISEAASYAADTAYWLAGWEHARESAPDLSGACAVGVMKEPVVDAAPPPSDEHDTASRSSWWPQVFSRATNTNSA